MRARIIVTKHFNIIFCHYLTNCCDNMDSLSQQWSTKKEFSEFYFHPLRQSIKSPLNRLLFRFSLWRSYRSLKSPSLMFQAFMCPLWVLVLSFQISVFTLFLTLFSFRFCSSSESFHPLRRFTSFISFTSSVPFSTSFLSSASSFPSSPPLRGVLSLAVALSQQPIGGHLSFALDVDLSSQLQLEAVELLQDVAGRRWHVDLQRCTHRYRQVKTTRAALKHAAFYCSSTEKHSCSLTKILFKKTGF